MGARKRLRRICLVGVRGVGKTTLIRSLIDQLPEVDYVLGSAVLRELAGEDFARFNRLPAATKQAYRERAIEWMEARQARVGRHILCDGHTALLDETTGRVETVFTELDCRFFRELILLEAPPGDVLARRAGDPSKSRSLNPDTVKAEVECESSSARQIAKTWGMTLHALPRRGPADLQTALLEILRR